MRLRNCPAAVSRMKLCLALAWVETGQPGKQAASKSEKFPCMQSLAPPPGGRGDDGEMTVALRSLSREAGRGEHCFCRRAACAPGNCAGILCEESVLNGWISRMFRN